MVLGREEIRFPRATIEGSMFVLFVLALEALACIRVVVRLVRTAGGTPVRAAIDPSGETIAAIVPVLDEEARLGPCLAALLASSGPLTEIVVVDGGSSDGTRDLVRAAATHDPRLRLIEAGPPPAGWNGKAWNLERGLRAVDADWIATVDADARVGPELIAGAAARASRDGLAALSIATRQLLGAAPSGAADHPGLSRRSSERRDRTPERGPGERPSLRRTTGRTCRGGCFSHRARVAL